MLKAARNSGFEKVGGKGRVVRSVDCMVRI